MIKSTTLYFLIGVISILYINYLPRLPLSLSLDETATYWIIKDGFWELVSRSTSIPNQFSAYNYALMLISSLIGITESAIRLPSLIFTIITSYFVYLLASELISISAARYSVVAFFLLNPTVPIATFARPYPLALLLLVISTYCLVRFSKTGDHNQIVVYCLAVVGMLYCHPIYLFCLPCHLAYILIQKTYKKLSGNYIYILISIISLALAPIIFLMHRNYGSSDDLVFAPPPFLLQFIIPFTPTPLLVSIIIYLITSLLFNTFGSIINSKQRKGDLLFLICWLVLPPVFLYIASLLSGTSLLVERYYSSYLPAVAILTGLFFDSIPDKYMRNITFVLMVVILMFLARTNFISSMQLAENWREAANFIKQIDPRAESLVLLGSGFVEGRNNRFLENPLFSSYLAAPLSYYRIPNKILNLPWTFNNDDNRNYYFRQIKPVLSKYRDTIILYRRWGSYGKNGRDKLAVPQIIADLSDGSFGSFKYYEFGSIAICHFRHREPITL
ncbi:MAG: glycosyltransferase family 39 protein [Geobacter sp.]|nr:glycosyltransferase family 39 protein [Geobacter sp.]